MYHMVSLEPFLLQAAQPQLFQPLPLGDVSADPFQCPLLDPLNRSILHSHTGLQLTGQRTPVHPQLVHLG